MVAGQSRNKMESGEFLARCKDMGLVVQQFEKLVPDAYGFHEDDSAEEELKFSPERKSQRIVLPTPKVKSMGSIFNELGQRSGTTPEHYCVELSEKPEKLYEHVIKFGEYSASHIDSTKKAAKSGAIETLLLRTIPDSFLSAFLPASDMNFKLKYEQSR